MTQAITERATTGEGGRPALAIESEAYDQSGSEAVAPGGSVATGLVHVPYRAGPDLGDLATFWPELGDYQGVGFRGREAVDIAASMFPKVEPVKQGRYRLTELTERVLVISPGAIRVRVSTAEPGGPDETWTDHLDDCVCDRCEIWGSSDIADEGRGTGVVSEFSYGARRRLMVLCAAVDWPTEVDRSAGERLAMLTLTYPLDWRSAAPSPDATLGHLNALGKRYKRATGRDLKCVWKREFQRRGAPHFHLLAAAPRTIRGEDLRSWLLRSWAEIVKSGDPKHFNAGTGVDWAQSVLMTDAKRVAAYFAGYTTKDAVEATPVLAYGDQEPSARRARQIKASKEYQHVVPEGWGNENGSAGRWWGSRHVERCESEVRLSDRKVIEAKRIARKVLKSQRRVKRLLVKRVDRETGEVRYRWVTRRFRLKSLQSRQARQGDGSDRSGELGFLLFLNDAPLFACQLARALALKG